MGPVYEFANRLQQESWFTSGRRMVRVSMSATSREMMRAFPWVEKSGEGKDGVSNRALLCRSYGGREILEGLDIPLCVCNFSHQALQDRTASFSERLVHERTTSHLFSEVYDSRTGMADGAFKAAHPPAQPTGIHVHTILRPQQAVALTLLRDPLGSTFSLPSSSRGTSCTTFISSVTPFRRKDPMLHTETPTGMVGTSVAVVGLTPSSLSSWFSCSRS